VQSDRTSGARRAGIEESIRAGIREGRLRAGDVLPSTRAFARDVGVARGTVVDAYSQLAAEGWIQTRPGAPTTVRAVASNGVAARPVTAAAEPFGLDLNPSLADLSAFPRARWVAAVRKVMQSAPDSVLGIADAQGRIELRAAIAAMLRRTRGVVAEADDVVIVNGFTQGLSLLSSLLARAGASSMAMEDPNLWLHREVVRHAGLDVCAVPVDDAGACTELLVDAAWTASGVRAMVATPSHQHPLGVAMAPARRDALLDWAVTTDGLIIEDDYDGDFRYDRQPPAALQARSPEHVVYAGTASKTLGIGLRIGWLVPPPRWKEALVHARANTDSGSPVLEQLALAELISSGAYERHVRKMRAAYRARRDRLVSTLAVRVPEVAVSGLAAGLHAVIELPAGGPGEHQVLERGARAGIRLIGLGQFWHDPTIERGQAVLLSFAAPPAHAFDATIDTVADVLAQSMRR
jgi:GntR family transcriptional regulator/MocR family aminotransferase